MFYTAIQGTRSPDHRLQKSFLEQQQESTEEVKVRGRGTHLPILSMELTVGECLGHANVPQLGGSVQGADRGGMSRIGQ